MEQLKLPHHPLRIGDHISRPMSMLQNMTFHHGIISRIISPNLDNIFVIHWIGGENISLMMNNFHYNALNTLNAIHDDNVMIGDLNDDNNLRNDNSPFDIWKNKMLSRANNKRNDAKKKHNTFFNNIKIKETSLREFLAKSQVYYIHHHPVENCRSREESVSVARVYLQSRHLDEKYDFFINNCEGFVLQCKLKIPLGKIPLSSQFKVGLGLTVGTLACVTLANHCLPNIHLLTEKMNENYDSVRWEEIKMAGETMVDYIEKELFGVVPKTRINIDLTKIRQPLNDNDENNNDKYNIFSL